MKRPMNQPVIVLTHEEREELKRLARKNKVMACFARRAKVILALDEGKSITETARLIGRFQRSTCLHLKPESLSPALQNKPSHCFFLPIS